MRIYWDRARVMVGGEATPLEVRRIRPAHATLEFGGYPRPASPDGRKPLAYDPDDVISDHQWKAHVGQYTPLGDVTSRVQSIDDTFVTTKHGDQIELVFDDPRPLTPGWTRTYLLYADGFGKDMDPNSAANNEVGPIPFHGMPYYPYGENLAPPTAGEPVDRVPRRVARSSDGLPGAIPLAQRLQIER